METAAVCFWRLFQPVLEVEEWFCSASRGESKGEIDGSEAGDFTRLARAAIKVFRISIMFVTGPVPPGTGVIAPATAVAEAKSTSPTILPFAQSGKLIPKSITSVPTAPSARCAPPRSPRAE